ncbi:MAG: barstar family protein [Sporichthyaceae bacterium]
MTPPFRLLDAEGAVLLVAADVEGLWVAGDRPAPARIHLLGVEFVAARARRFDDVDLQIARSDGATIGSYFLGRLDIDQTRRDTADRYAVEAVLERGALAGEHSAAIWRRFASDLPLTVGEWRLNPADWHSSWIHVAQTAWFHDLRDTGRSPDLLGTPAVVDGRGLPNRDSFWCALGEAVNGVGGYFGSSLGGLEDCLRGSRTEEFPLPLEWHDLEDSRATLGGTFVDMVIGVLADYRVAVTEA